MFPHELVKQYFGNNPVDDVVELQWNSIIEEVLKGGQLKVKIFAYQNCELYSLFDSTGQHRSL
jgi:hypothetical protein